MALNTNFYFTNPTKGKTVGLNDTIRYNTYVYSALLTVSSSNTYIIKNGYIGIDYVLGVPAANIQVNLVIGGKKISLYREDVTGGGTDSLRFTFKDKGVENILLSTGDTVHIEFFHDDATLAPVGNINAFIYIEDYTA
jgi:hypothetical protein